MNLDSRQKELLGILQEEAAEVIQAVSKLERFPDSFDTNLSKLHVEIGDFVGVMKMLIDEGTLNSTLIHAAAEAKIPRVEKYMKNKKGNK